MVFEPLLTLPDGLKEAECWFVFRGNHLLVASGDGGFSLPQAEIAATLPSPLRSHVLGLLGGKSCCGVEVAQEIPPPPGHEFLGLRTLFGRFDEALLALAGRAFQIIDWDRTHQFCGRCGTPTQLRDHERVRTCPACGLSAYPRIAPVVMGLVQRGRELLLARSPHFAPGVYSAIAGYCEAGENLETALQREIREEVGVEVDDIRYFRSQSWPFPHSLMIAFTCRYRSGQVVPQPGEIEDARWFSVDNLPPLPHPVSIARQLIEAGADHIRHKIHEPH
ncbi:MAG: NAD(+) diphosphatase [Betaproteobacteria bacterium]|nr:NAD(+) diphosphatase [Betaproteobacteria bacterium]MDE2621843.1 NAD(+) diphosphatase [Betaproteobacteria bacterium]